VKPVMAAAAAAGPSTDAAGEEEHLVVLAQAGSSEAFEALFRRYRERITAFVRTIVPNHARAEDVVQEIFVSALRKLHTLERPAAFKSWLYEIARNACVDDVRRVQRNGEVLVQSNDFAPYDEQRHRQAQSTHGMVSWREDLDHLREALGGLPDSQHEALLLREFAGMSYDEIGRQMNLSRPAVESTLFRARRGLRDEYSEITTGRRCRRMQRVIAEIAEGLGGAREKRALARHLRDCQGCRRQATALGVTGELPVEGPFRRTVARIGAILPLPFLFNRGREGSDQLAGGSSLGVQAHGFATQVAAVSNISPDHVGSAIHKTVAVVAAVAVIGGGAGVAVKESGVRIPVVNAKKHGRVTHDSAAGKKLEPALPGAAGAGKSTGLPVKPPAKSPVGVPGAVPRPSAIGPVPSTSPTAPPSAMTPQTGVTTPASPGKASPGVPSATTGTGSGTGGEPAASETTTGGTEAPSGDSTAPTDTITTPSTTDQPGSAAGGTQPSPPTTEGLPSGWQKKLESGEVGIDDLPKGLAKKLR
jgi:RNA polymerase sigma factor (sigma-70 family)